LSGYSGSQASSAQPSGLTAVDRHAVKDGVKITDRYFLVKGVDYLFKPLPKTLTSSSVKLTKSAILQSIPTTDGGADNGNVGDMVRAGAFLFWPGVILLGLILIVGIIDDVAATYRLALARQKSTYAGSISAKPSKGLYLFLVLALAFLVFVVSPNTRYQAVIFDNATTQACRIEIGDKSIQVPAKTYVVIDLMCGTQDMVFHFGTTDAKGSRVVLEVEKVLSRTIYNISSSNTYTYDSATYLRQYELPSE
jgi:hypothetical protein